ncbi:MAG TPA: hypothetical protein V6D07_18655 [Trichocoleus sp.]
MSIIPGCPFKSGDKVRLKPEKKWSYGYFEGTVTGEVDDGELVVNLDTPVQIAGSSFSTFTFQWPSLELVSSQEQEIAKPDGEVVLDAIAPADRIELIEDHEVYAPFIGFWWFGIAVPVVLGGLEGKEKETLIRVKQAFAKGYDARMAGRHENSFYAEKYDSPNLDASFLYGWKVADYFQEGVVPQEEVPAVKEAVAAVGTDSQVAFDNYA